MRPGKEVIGIQIDFDDPDLDLGALDKSLLETHPEGFVRNCCVDEKIQIMQRIERCPTHCWVKRGLRLYLELPKEMHYPESP